MFEAKKNPNIKIKKPKGLSIEYEIFSDNDVFLIKNFMFFNISFLIKFLKTSTRIIIIRLNKYLRKSIRSKLYFVNY